MNSLLFLQTLEAEGVYAETWSAVVKLKAHGLTNEYQMNSSDFKTKWN